MSTSSLHMLFSYLTCTLSRSNMKWLGEHLIEASSVKVKEDLNTKTLEAIQESESGKCERFNTFEDYLKTFS